MATDTEAINRLVTAAPTLALPQEAMEQIVGWSSNEQRPVTLREFVAARARPWCGPLWQSIRWRSRPSG